MNEGTLIVISGYDGDAHQIETFLPAYEHHKRPILCLSPVDAPIRKLGPHGCRSAGKRAYVGQLSLDRQLAHMKECLSLPFDFYLMNDSDSFCISPEIPRYLYQNPDIFWSNEVLDHRVRGEPDENGNIVPMDYHVGYPLIAMQPPYFVSRPILEKMVRAGRTIEPDGLTPFIDWYMVQCVYGAGVAHQKFHDCACFGTVPQENADLMVKLVREGANMVHAIKTKETFERIQQAYQERE
jgi:hypothetical protein